MQRQEKPKIIKKLSDIPGAKAILRYDEDSSHPGAYQAEYVNNILRALPNERDIYAPVSMQLAEMSRCIVAIERFKQEFADKPNVVNQGLQKLTEISDSPIHLGWHGIMLHYDEIRDLYLENAGDDAIASALRKAADEKQHTHSDEFRKLFPGCRHSERELESKFSFVLSRYQTFPETKSDSKSERVAEIKSAKNLDPTIYVYLKNLIDAIARGENLNGNLLNQLENAIKDIPGNVLDNVTKDQLTLQELLLDRYWEKSSKPEIAKDLLGALDILFKAGVNKHIKSFNSQRGLLHRLVEQPLSPPTAHPLVLLNERTSMEEMIVFLYKNEIDFNSPDSEGNTPLHFAATNRLYAYIFQTLTWYGAGLNIANQGKNLTNERQTPLDILNQQYENSKDPRIEKLIETVRDLGGKTWKEIQQTPLAPLVRMEDFKLIHFITTYNLNFTRGLKDETFFTLCRMDGILTDLFSCEMLKAKIQSQLPCAQLKPLLDEVQAINKKREDERKATQILKEQKEQLRELSRQSDAEKKQKDEKKQSAQAKTPEMAIATLVSVCKAGYFKTEKKQAAFDAEINFLRESFSISKKDILEQVKKRLPPFKTGAPLIVYGKYAEAYKAPTEQSVPDKVSSSSLYMASS